MKHFFYIILFIFFSLQTLGQPNSPNNGVVSVNEFKSLIDTIGLVFDMPKGFIPAMVKENGDLYYSFAVINLDSTMQVRYTVFPIKPQLVEYEISLKDPNTKMVHPNKMYNSIVEANMLNMTGGKSYKIGPFSKTAVKKEFNADDGGSCFFDFNCEFGKGFKYGHFVYLHKDNIADVIITYMDNDKQKHNALMETPFHSLRFK